LIEVQMILTSVFSFIGLQMKGGVSRFLDMERNEGSEKKVKFVEYGVILTIFWEYFFDYFFFFFSRKAVAFG
jgi:hypothetical protein